MPKTILSISLALCSLLNSAAVEPFLVLSKYHRQAQNIPFVGMPGVNVSGEYTLTQAGPLDCIIYTGYANIDYLDPNECDERVDYSTTELCQPYFKVTYTSGDCVNPGPEGTFEGLFSDFEFHTRKEPGQDGFSNGESEATLYPLDSAGQPTSWGARFVAIKGAYFEENNGVFGPTPGKKRFLIGTKRADANDYALFETGITALPSPFYQGDPGTPFRCEVLVKRVPSYKYELTPIIPRYQRLSFTKAQAIGTAQIDKVQNAFNEASLKLFAVAEVASTDTVVPDWNAFIDFHLVEADDQLIPSNLPQKATTPEEVATLVDAGIANVIMVTAVASVGFGPDALAYGSNTGVCMIVSPGSGVEPGIVAHEYGHMVGLSHHTAAGDATYIMYQYFKLGESLKSLDASYIQDTSLITLNRTL